MVNKSTQSKDTIIQTGMFHKLEFGKKLFLWDKQK